jgi:alcohol dehydrogenase (NADP+)
MLELAASGSVGGWIQEWPMDKINEALIAMDAGKARYRYVLTNTKHKGLAE